MNIETPRLIITNFTPDMAKDVHKNSLDDDTRRFLPDEVFETVEDAANTIDFLISQYEGNDGPFVYPILLKDRTNIGYVQAVHFDNVTNESNCENAVPLENGIWEIGYHIAKKFTGKGYASEAVTSFLPVIMKQLDIKKIYGVCDAENIASCKVLEKCGFKLAYEGSGEYQGKNTQIKKYEYVM